VAIPATTSINNWNRSTQHVEAAIRSGRYINAETCLLFAGPPRVSDMTGNVSLSNGGLSGGISAVASGKDALYPIGLVESFGVQQVQNVQKMFEIGSRRSYQAGGRVQVVGDLGRVMFNGPSLLRALYAYYPNSIQMANGKVLGKGGSPDSISSVIAQPDNTNAQFPPIFFEPGSFAAADTEISQQPNSFFFNLMSELFSHPFGFGFLLRDNKNQNYGAIYIEDCFISAHSFRVSSSSTLITETASFQADACIPMEFNTQSGAQLAALGL
jgi:hypothetical protein